MLSYISKLRYHPLAIPTCVGLVGTVGGFLVGYSVGKTRINRELLEITQEVIEETNQSAKDWEEVTKNIKDLGYLVESSLPSEPVLTVVSPLRPNPKDIVVDHQPNVFPSTVEVEPEEVEPEEAEPQMQNVFANANEDGWDYERECSTRTAETPYVIHVDEFMSDEMEFEQGTLTYYQGDDILTNENDVPIYNYSKLVGDLKFGYGSRDPNVVYIRNEKLQLEYEILLHKGLYSVEVLGHQIENEMAEKDLKHSSHLKFRDD